MESQPSPARPRLARRPALVWIMLIGILLVGAYFRTLSLTDWDDGTGQHPDERFFTDVATNVRLPASLGELYDSARSPLNPRSYSSYPLYVYGPFPIYVTRFVAAALTPNDGPDGPILPLQVRSIGGPPRAGADPSAPDEVRTDYGPLVENPERAIPKIGPLIALLNPDGLNLTGYGEIVKVGRALAMLFDLGAILLIFLIARRLFDDRVGLLAAVLSALAVMQIQQSHFFVDPIFSTFFALVTLYWAVRVAQGGSWLSYTALGLSIGAAMANRITLATLGLAAIAAALLAALQFIRRSPRNLQPSTFSLQHFFDRFLTRDLPLLMLAGALTFLSFRTLAPDAFSGSRADSPEVAGPRVLDIGLLEGKGFLDIRPEPRFLGNLTTVRGLVSGEYDFPPSQQWVGRTAYAFPWTNMVLWGMGPALGLAAWAGWLAFAVVWVWRVRPKHSAPVAAAESSPWPWAQNASALPAATWVLWVWAGFYFGWQGAQFAITMRYLLPIYGALIIFAAWLLVRLWDWGQEAGGRRQEAGGRRQEAGLQQTSRWVRALARWAPIVVLLLTMGWAYAFSRIYAQPHSRVIAARWLADHAPPGSLVMAEIWDDPLPLQTTAASWGGTYFGLESAPYAEDEPRKYFGAYNRDGKYDEGLIDQLDQADYITLTSNRVYASTARLRMRYPALMNYYRGLFDGSLGFTLAAEVTSYPSILGVQIPDQAAEEAFSVYDHPRVLIFEKTAAYSRQRAEELITQPVSWDEVYKSPVHIADRNPTALRLTTSQWPRYTAGGTWLSLYPDGVWAALAPLSWGIVLELLGLAAFALLFRLLPGLPDRGFSLAKILGLLAVAYLAWLLGSLGNGTGLPGMAGGAGGLATPLLPLPFTPGTLWLCAAPLLAGGAYTAWRSRAELRAFWQERRAALLSAQGIFLGFLLLGLLLRWLNPDLWHPARGGEKPMDFAYLNAVLKSAAFPPYDPWHAGGYINYYYFGFVIIGALIHLSGAAPSVGYNLAVATLFGLTALGAWGVVYNLQGTGSFGTRKTRKEAEDADAEDAKSRASGTLPPASERSERPALISAALAPALLLLLGGLTQAFWYISGYAAEQLPKNRPEWAFWDATRIVPGTVNEFPFFTFLFADLHAHMIVMPLSLALLGMGVAFVRGQEAGGRRQVAGGRWAGLLPSASCLLLMGLLAGAIRATNTWDYPTYVGLTALTMAWATFRAQRARGRSPIGAAVAGLLLPVAFLLIGNLLFTPFTANFATESSGVQLLSDGGVPGLLGALFAAQRTTTWEIIQLYGLWLFVAAAAGLLLVRRLAGPLVAAGMGIALAALALAGSLLGWPSLVLSLPMLTVGALLLWQLRRLPTASQIPILWGTAAIGLVTMVELVVVKGDVGRMNTVFKFGLHTWTLFALSAAVAIPWLWVGDRGQGTGYRRQAAGGRRQAGWAIWLLRGSLALLLAAALVYPLTATPARLADRWDPQAPRTLDGTTFMKSISEAHHGQGNSLDEDAAAISWLQQNVPGTPVILEAHLPSYQWAGRVATFTGLPTILGWEWHQVQQRNAVAAGQVIAARQQTVATIYNTPDPQQARADLRRYGVEYLYVGGVERATYDAAGLAKFPGMVGSGDLAVAFQSGQTIIYRVTQPGQPQMLTSDLPLDPPTARTPPPLMLREPVNELPAVDEYAWNGLAGDSSWASTLFWLLAIYALAALGLPVARLAFGRAADGGWAWAKMIGLLTLGYAVWLPTSLGLWHYNAWGLLGGLVIVLAINSAILIAGEQAGEGDGRPRSPARRLLDGLRALLSTLLTHRRGVILGELVFLGGFVALALIRALNPDLWHPTWGGEKPMEFGFLNAILRSPVMPPYDPFFSGGYINYYYYGLYLVSLPIKLSGINPAIGFNLAVATVFGLTLAGAYATVVRITGRARYGLVGAAMVGLAGNLTAVIAAGWSRGLPAVWQALAEGGLAGLGARLGDWYIGPSRVIPFTINEFPAFTFLFADLHPHMIALPIALLAAGAAYEVVADRTGNHMGLPLLALALGALAVTNSWDFPTYALLAGLAIVGAAWRRGDHIGAAGDHIGAAGDHIGAAGDHIGAAGDHIGAAGDHIGAPLRAAAVALGGLAMYAPFFDRYFAFVRGVGAVPLAGGTSIPNYLLVFGLPLAILLPAVGGAAWRITRHQRATALNRWVALGLALALAALAIAMPAHGLRVALAGLLLLGARLLLERRAGPAAWFTLLLAWVAWAVSLGIELVYIRDHLDGGDWFRMNTVFKFGLQAWVLLGLAAAASLPASLRALRRLGGRPAQAAGLAGLATIGLLAAAYPLIATPSRVANRFDVQTGPTLDGLAFMRQTSFDYDCSAFGGCPPGIQRVTIDLRGDAAAIDWLNREISGTPIIVQSDLWFYRAYGIRIAANTGLPTVISALHENEQRDPTLTGKRDADVADFYSSTEIDGALRFLAKYQVNYIYVGGVERAVYPAEGLAKFAAMEGSYLSRVYDAQQVQIYQVRGVPQSYAMPEPVSRPADTSHPDLPPGAISAELEALERATAANPGDGPTAFGLADRYRAMGRPEDAVRVLAPAARANPQDIGLHHLLGDILAEIGRYDEAEQAYLAAAQAGPSAGNWNKLGAALLSWGKIDKAELALRQAVATDPSLPDPHYYLGQLFAQRQEREQAIGELQTYLDLAPDGPWAGDASKILADLAP